MQEIRKYLKFFFQTERIHPMHVFAFICFLIFIITLPFQIIVSLVEKDYLHLISQAILLICFVGMFVAGSKAYRDSQNTDSQDS